MFPNLVIFIFILEKSTIDRYTSMLYAIFTKKPLHTMYIPNTRKGKTAMTVTMASLIFAAMVIPTIQLAFAQSSGSVQGSAQIAYKTAYPKTSVDSNNSVTVQAEHHLYRPGDSVKITGSVASEMRQETESDTVTVRVVDAQGMVVANQQAQVSSNGEYSATIRLPATADEGAYSASSKLEVEASILGLLDAQIVAKLESKTPASFVVATESSFEVTVQTDNEDVQNEFSIDIASNSTVDAVELRQEQKMVTFRVEGETGTTGVAQVTIPKAMLSGEMSVMIDGQAVSPDSNDVIVTSNTQTETTFEINYLHSEHEVAVTGTNVAPEFPVSAMIMAAAIGSVVAVMAAGKRTGFFSRV